MAKKDSGPSFNMSEEIRGILASNPQASSKEVVEAIQGKFPKAKINKNSFSVAFYTTRNKLGISVSGRRKSGKTRVVRGAAKGQGHTVDLDALKSAAKFLNEVGSVDAAIEAIKTVQAIQLV